MNAASAIRPPVAVNPASTAHHEPSNELATVIANLGQNMFLTQSGEQGRACRRAASCLLLPEVGDTVLLAGAGGSYYLLAVIERMATTPAQLQVEGDLQLVSSTGSVSVQACTTLHLKSEALAVQAQAGQVNVDKMQLVGSLWQGALGTTRLVAQVCETMAGRLVQHATSSFRTIEQIERVRAGQLDLQAKDLIRIHAKNVMARATDVYKVAAKLMHMG